MSETRILLFHIGEYEILETIQMMQLVKCFGGDDEIVLFITDVD